jgi:transmembrane sensor
MTDTSEISELRAIRAQAAVWVTDLHGPDRTAALEAGLRHWLAEDPRHRQAFELATEAWQRSGNLPANLSDATLPRMRLSGMLVAHPIRAVSFAGAAILATLLALGFYYLKDPVISTGDAEQRIVDLTDGTQVTLNANSRLLVNYTQQARQITLMQGEALFNVTKHQSRPFVVIMGPRKVIALGTSFEVRREEARGSTFTVTLIEGRVAIEPISSPNALPIEAPKSITILEAGQRLRMATKKPDALDTPPIEKVTAWQHGQLIFEDISIRDAAKEFNRYGRRKLSIDANVADTLRVGGVFRIGDPESFARAVATAYQLLIAETPEEIKLTAH